MFDNLKEWILHKAVIRGVEAMAKFALAWLATPQVMEALGKCGISIDMAKLNAVVYSKVPLVVSAILFCVAFVYQHYQMYKNKKAQ